MKSLEEIRNIFSGDIYATDTTGIVIEEARPGYCRVTLKIDRRHGTAAGRVMGAVYFTMADFAFAVANNAELTEPVAVTLSSQINFLSGARGGTLYAEAKAVRSGRHTGFYDITVTDDLGTLIATVSSVSYRG